MRALVILAVGLLAIPAVQAETTVDQASGYPWAIEIEDPADDHTGPTPAADVETPNDHNPESDIRLVQITDDATTLVIKVTMATCTFGVSNGFAMIIIEAPPYELTAQYDDGCADPSASEADSLLAPAPVVGGDNDDPIAGLRVEAVPDENAIYMFSDYAENGLAPGDVLSISRIHTGRQFTDPGRYTFGLDEADTADFTVGSGAVLFGPADPPAETVLGDLDGELRLSFQNATSDTHLLNWSALPGTLQLVAEAAAGDVAVSFGDEATTLANDTASFDANQTGVLNLTFNAFVGNITVTHVAPGADGEGPGGDDTPATDGTEPDGTDAGNTTGNGTSLDGATDDKGSPAPAVALLAMLVLWAARRQR